MTLRIIGPYVASRAAERDPALAICVADEAATAARHNPVPSAEATALWFAGLAGNDPDPILAAVDRFERSPRALSTADAATDAVRLLRRAGRRAEAMAVYERARQRQLAAGATGDLERLRRAAGLRRTGAITRPRFGWDSLTRSERRVVELLQEGHTNRQIGDLLGISRRTVETHLAHVFAKVGVTTRVELAVAAARR